MAADISNASDHQTDAAAGLMFELVEPAHDFTEKGPYKDVYPPVQEPQARVLVVVAAFLLCFIVGICGNSSVLTIIRYVVKRKRRSQMDRRGMNTDYTILYIAALCVVDFIVSLSLPPAIVDNIIGFWMFGTVVCKLHHVCGSVGRIASTFIMTAMSFDRYVAVCHPHKRHLRSKKTVLTLIFGLSFVAFLLLLPMLYHARPQEVLLHRAVSYAGITRVRIFKCSDMMPKKVFYWFTMSTFLLGYLVPLLLILGFNVRMIRRLYMHKRKMRSSTIPLRRITGYTALIAIFYFVCWTPYWVSVLYAIYLDFYVTDQSAESSSELLLYIIYCVHLLPYFNSASNWILYGLLNSQLQQRMEGRQGEPSMSTMETTNGHNGHTFAYPAETESKTLRSASLAVGANGTAMSSSPPHNTPIKCRLSNGKALTPPPGIGNSSDSLVIASGDCDTNNTEETASNDVML